MRTYSSIKKASKVERARGRLENAIDHLESIVEHTPFNSSDKQKLSPFEGNRQINQLSEKIKTLEAEKLSLNELNQLVSSRLGIAIGRLKALIGD